MIVKRKLIEGAMFPQKRVQEFIPASGKPTRNKLNQSTSKVALMIPLKGVSAIAIKGQVFYDEKADEALFSTIRKNIKPNIELIELDYAINDEEFSNALALKLLSYLN